VWCSLAGVDGHGTVRPMRELLILAIHLLVTFRKRLRPELIAAIVEMNRRNPRFGCARIARQIAHAFGVDIDKDVMRRVLAKHDRPGDSGTNGPSWLTFIGHVKDTLWSFDLFRCESILLRSHWVLLVMDALSPAPASLDRHAWRQHSRGLYQTPIAA
jgi:hypothetical protein